MPNLNPALFSSNRADWGTPWDLFRETERKYGPFDLDVCAASGNAKCPQYFSPADDALSRQWAGRCWMNPPYGRVIAQWVEKAWLEIFFKNADRVVCLLPARTDTRWWHDYVLKYAARIDFIRGRVKFEGAAHNAPFPSAIAVFDRSSASDIIYRS